MALATMKASRILCSPSCSHSSTSSSSSRRSTLIRATINMPKLRENTISLVSKLTSSGGLVEEMDQYTSSTTISLPKLPATNFTEPDHDHTRVSNPAVISKLYAIMEAVADRVEMHKNVGEQRDRWNSLLLTSINAITLTAATMSGIAAASSVVPGAPLAALKLSSTLLYLGATGMLIIMNKIQPSQLAEEQRNATRLFKQLHGEIQTKLAIEIPTNDDVNEALEKVLAIDRAFPLPLLGRMLEKFPSKVEPAVWWPQQRIRRQAKVLQNGENGWNGKLEEEMREIVRVLEIKDKDDYLGLGKKALKLNKVLAIAGPLLSGIGAVASAASNGSWAVVLGVVAGAVVSVLNTLEHGGQVGMVFEMYRSNAGFYQLVQESIESNLKERDIGRRENGELFEMKVALQLGRSLSELRELAASSARKGMDIEEFASKLF